MVATENKNRLSPLQSIGFEGVSNGSRCLFCTRPATATLTPQLSEISIKAVANKILQLLLVPEESLVELQDSRLLRFCHSCFQIVRDVRKSMTKIQTLEVQIKAEIEVIGKLIVDSSSPSPVKVKDGRRKPSPAQRKLTVVSDTFRKRVAQNYLDGRLPNPVVLLEKFNLSQIPINRPIPTITERNGVVGVAEPAAGRAPRKIPLTRTRTRRNTKPMPKSKPPNNNNNDCSLSAGLKNLANLNIKRRIKPTNNVNPTIYGSRVAAVPVVRVALERLDGQTYSNFSGSPNAKDKGASAGASFAKNENCNGNGNGRITRVKRRVGVRVKSFNNNNPRPDAAALQVKLEIESDDGRDVNGTKPGKHLRSQDKLIKIDNNNRKKPPSPPARVGVPALKPRNKKVEVAASKSKLKAEKGRTRVKLNRNGKRPKATNTKTPGPVPPKRKKRANPPEPEVEVERPDGDGDAVDDESDIFIPMNPLELRKLKHKKKRDSNHRKHQKKKTAPVPVPAPISESSESESRSASPNRNGLKPDKVKGDEKEVEEEDYESSENEVEVDDRLPPEEDDDAHSLIVRKWVEDSSIPASIDGYHRELEDDIEDEDPCTDTDRQPTQEEWSDSRVMNSRRQVLQYLSEQLSRKDDGSLVCNLCKFSYPINPIDKKKQKEEFDFLLDHVQEVHYSGIDVKPEIEVNEELEDDVVDQDHDMEDLELDLNDLDADEDGDIDDDASTADQNELEPATSPVHSHSRSPNSKSNGRIGREKAESTITATINRQCQRVSITVIKKDLTETEDNIPDLMPNEQPQPNDDDDVDADIDAGADAELELERFQNAANYAYIYSSQSQNGESLETEQETGSSGTLDYDCPKLTTPDKPKSLPPWFDNTDTGIDDNPLSGPGIDELFISQRSEMEERLSNIRDAFEEGETTEALIP